MKNMVTLLLCSFLFASSLLLAKQTAPVKHSHNGRTHTHPLPSTGIHHNHNKSTHSSSQKKTYQNSHWVFVVSSRILPSTAKYKNIYHAKAGSLRISNNKVIVIGKVADTLRNTIKLEKWSVPLSHCRNQMGKISWYKIDGKYIGASDFVFGSGNVASGIAEVICNAALK